MTTAYTSLLGLALPVTGELSGTWGDTVNNSITSLLDTAVAGTTTLSTDADVTLTSTTGASNQARQAILLCSGARTALRTITAPAQSKIYTVINSTTGGYSVKVVGVGPTTGVTIVAGESAMIAWNGSDFIKISNTSGAGTFTDLTVTGNTTLGDASTDTATINAAATFNANAIISVTDNTNAALRITQLGTGNALLVEDSTNPDSTPFVIDASGNTIIGYTTALNSRIGATTITPALQIAATSFSKASLGQFGYNTASYQVFSRSASSTIGTYSVLSSGDIIGRIEFTGDDGTNFTSAARIESAVDGTPGTNDMPGRLVFSTTADGASSPTERMRIDSAGQVGIGVTPTAGRTLTIGKSLTGATSIIGVSNNGTIAPDATGSNSYYSTLTATASNGGTPYTVNSITSYNATQGTFNADSTVTNQYGFVAANTLTGATNNYGFYGNIASGTNRWNLYMAGTASNYMAGSLGVGSNALTARIFVVGGSVTGATGAYGALVSPTVQPDVTSNALITHSQANTAANGGTPYTIAALSVFNAAQGTFNADSTVTSQYGFLAAASLTGATNNYGFYGNIASATGRWNLYMAGTASNYLAGNLGIGGTPSAGQILRVGGSLTGSTSSRQVIANGVVASDVTARADSFYSVPQTAASAFTLGILSHFHAVQSTIGATSSVTTQIGFEAESSLTGATSNYGFYGNIASGSNRWNFYAAGTADNYFAGNVGIGTSSPSYSLTVVSNSSAVGLATYGRSSDNLAGTYWFSNNGATTYGTILASATEFRLTSTPAAAVQTFYTNGSERMRIDSSGNVGIGTSSPSNTNKLDVVADGSDKRIAMRTQDTSGNASVEAQVNNYWSGATYTGTALVQYDSAATGTTVGLSNANLGILRFQNGSAGLIYTNSSVPIVFGTVGTERARIDSSGNLLINRTTVYNSERLGVTYSSNTGACAVFNDTNPQNGNTFLQFRNGGTTAGSITSNGTTTMTYGSASDYRLKKDLVPMTGGLEKIELLKPKTGKWIGDDSDFSGFVAHELQEVFPDAVVGEKDKVDGQGNPEYQMVDTGSASLIATLTAAIQELKAINDQQAQTITALTARIEALEGK